ncbi:OmpA family protein [Mongoliimonas terrestris]|uniref:OmpA family protein n=1 Tax=Mongoliimonas terrestris TaxID=1709001 RepID=UPI0009495C93|nr:OmpA family protein [Mongoliimonas terrestris]
MFRIWTVRLGLLGLGIGLAGLPAPATAQTGCAGTLAALQATYGKADLAAVLAGWKSVEADATCAPAQVSGARSQVSAVIARLAQDRLASGDVDGAEETVRQAPGVHWAVQAVRGDIAAKRGERDEASKLYNAALDSIGDPALTAQSEGLVPVASRLAMLAQENMMLAGSMEATVTRGGEASGVMAVIARGLAVERAAAGAPAAAAPAAAPAATAPAPQVAQPVLVQPQQVAVAAPAAPQPQVLQTQTVQPQVVQAPAAVQPQVVQLPAVTPAPAAPAPAAAGVQLQSVQIQSGDTFNVISAAALQVQRVFVPIRFGFDSDQLDEGGAREAARLAAFMKANAVPGVLIAGHTDDVGDPTYNLDLSLRRARTLAEFLIKDGVTSRIEIVGKGEAEPPVIVDSGVYSQDELRTIARRVEVAFGS